ncbi:hypothetical protein GW17_00007308 [Ensete ventricosum]|nr:hypothetical protein GW17_00007308 [Ensete ventricosum]
MRCSQELSPAAREHSRLQRDARKGLPPAASLAVNRGGYRWVKVAAAASAGRCRALETMMIRRLNVTGITRSYDWQELPTFWESLEVALRRQLIPISTRSLPETFVSRVEGVA